jgi:hypothetical protein
LHKAAVTGCVRNDGASLNFSGMIKTVEMLSRLPNSVAKGRMEVADNSER